MWNCPADLKYVRIKPYSDTNGFHLTKNLMAGTVYNHQHEQETLAINHKICVSEVKCRHAFSTGWCYQGFLSHLLNNSQPFS